MKKDYYEGLIGNPEIGKIFVKWKMKKKYALLTSRWKEEEKICS